MHVQLNPLFAHADTVSRFASGGEASSAWFKALCHHAIEPQESAQLLVLLEESMPVAALPLALRPDGSLRALTAPYTTRFAPAASGPAAAEQLGVALGGVVANRLELDCLDPDSPATDAMLRGMRKSGLVFATYRHFANWHEELPSFDEYWAGRPGSLRSTVERKMRKAHVLGARFRLAVSPADIRDLLPQYLEIYAASGKVAEPHPGFIPAMVEELGARGEIRLGLFYLRDRPVAAQIWLVQDGEATIFKLAHRQDCSACSPGTLLTYWMFSQLLTQEKIRRADFGRGDDGYKRNWLCRRSYRRGVIACNPRNSAGLRILSAQILPTWLGSWIKSPNPEPGRSPASSISTGASRPTSPATESIMSS